MKNNPIFTIVIAAYNVAEYLEEAVNSIFRQEIDDEVEVIIVNDGSTDGSELLLQSLSEKYSSKNLKVISQENQGLSAARNTGILAANGEYILFLDGDDLYVKNSLKYLTYALKSVNPDCLIVDFNWYWRKDAFKAESSYKLPNKKLIEDNMLGLNSMFQTAQFYAWRHIFKREIVKQVLFPVGKNYEDVSTVPLCLFNSKSIYYFSLPVVQYRQREGSIMKVKNEKNILDLSGSLLRVKEFWDANLTDTEKESICLNHSVFNAYLFTWSCGDTLSNPLLDPRALYSKFIDNFNNANMVTLSEIKSGMKTDMKNWRKFILFYKYPELFYLAFKLRHKYNRLYRGLNKLREFIYKT